ncbi:MAG TPA: hypothetical protein VNF47_27250 [Streptosporangiaceae bacterium]|nr:hypothetical protein [Streptosporangiaceae bacterium]
MITALTMVGAMPGLASSAGHPGPAGLLAGVRGLHAGMHRAAASNSDTGQSDEVLTSAAQYAAIRTAPALTVSAQAFAAAIAQARRLRGFGGGWQEVTRKPYNSDALGYRDPIWSNSSGGAGDVAGRITALAVDGHTLYAGAAAGGVWRSTDGGKHWVPVFDRQSDLSIGALAVNPADHSIWVGTGEANTSQDSYAGNGIYRSVNHGRTWRLIGQPLLNHTVFQITFDKAGHVYAATSQGLYRRTSSNLWAPWVPVLNPVDHPGSPYGTASVTDVKVRPGTGGQTVIAAIGWRGGTLPIDLTNNGFYSSTDGGHNFSEVTLTGDLAGATDIGRTTFAYSADGKVLYALVEKTTTLGLKGVYESANGDLAGPWKLIADSAKLAAPAVNSAYALSGGTPGAQAWYNQAIIVDPSNDSHVFVDLEEVFETSDAGATWFATGPYWNFPYPCWSADPTKDTCPNTVHADQHALAISGGTLYTGDDGGVYAHPLADVDVVKWADLNATLHTLEYYYAAVGRAPGGGVDIWGGLQDNGVSLLSPHSRQMVSPFGGDGGDVIVNPANGDQAVNEYVDLNMASTVNGGRSDGTTESYNTMNPSCFNVLFTPSPCDPNPRFIAPYTADIHNINHWVAGGEFVWDNQSKGWATSCSPTTCDWVPVHDVGAGNSINAIADSGSVTYAGWCGNGCNPGGASPFISGIDTNFGGTWHTVSSPVLPNRIPTSFTIDPRNAAHVVVTFGAFSRKWIAGGGVGHVFQSFNGGATWTNVSGNLPDVPAEASARWHRLLVVGTDIGVFATSARNPGRWFRLGFGLPAAPVDDLRTSPDQGFLLVATHGRGLWRIGSRFGI